MPTRPKGWRKESARHSLASRGIKTSCSKSHCTPMKSAKRGPRPTTVAKWLENWFENYRVEQLAKEREALKELDIGDKYSMWNKNSFMVIVDTGKDEKGLDYIEVRTDSTVYDLFYDPSISDFPNRGYKAQSELNKSLEEKFPGLYFEHMGGGVLRAYMWNG